MHVVAMRREGRTSDIYIYQRCCCVSGCWRGSRSAHSARHWPGRKHHTERRLVTVRRCPPQDWPSQLSTTRLVGLTLASPTLVGPGTHCWRSTDISERGGLCQESELHAEARDKGRGSKKGCHGVTHPALAVEGGEEPVTGLLLVWQAGIFYARLRNGICADNPKDKRGGIAALDGWTVYLTEPDPHTEHITSCHSMAKLKWE